jgi:hypothetical protein
MRMSGNYNVNENIKGFSHSSNTNLFNFFIINFSF